MPAALKSSKGSKGSKGSRVKKVQKFKRFKGFNCQFENFQFSHFPMTILNSFQKKKELSLNGDGTNN
jgi:hypothetical protein